MRVAHLSQLSLEELDAARQGPMGTKAHSVLHFWRPHTSHTETDARGTGADLSIAADLPAPASLASVRYRLATRTPPMGG